MCLGVLAVSINKFALEVARPEQPLFSGLLAAVWHAQRSRSCKNCRDRLKAPASPSSRSLTGMRFRLLSTVSLLRAESNRSRHAHAQIAALISTKNPTEALIATVSSLIMGGASKVVVVDDGSCKPEALTVIERLKWGQVSRSFDFTRTLARPLR